MGSLTSSPKVPTPTSTVVYVPTPTATTAVTTTTATNAAESAASAQDNAAQSRVENLLTRNRGRFGTVSGGFRGFLTQTPDSVNKRKTLLGE